MPTYEYRCKGCGRELEAVQSFSDPSLTVCPHCGGPLRKVFGSIGITFKGDGFYKNDSRSSSKRAAAAAASNGDSSSSSGDHSHSHDHSHGSHSHSTASSTPVPVRRLRSTSSSSSVDGREHQLERLTGARGRRRGLRRVGLLLLPR